MAWPLTGGAGEESVPKFIQVVAQVQILVGVEPKYLFLQLGDQSFLPEADLIPSHAIHGLSSINVKLSVSLTWNLFGFLVYH